MKHLFNLKLHPAIIISSVLFWFVLFFLIYLAILFYWLHKVANAHDISDLNVNVINGGTTVVLHRIGKTIYRKELKFYCDSLKVFAKR